MVALLALLSSLLWGTSDFLGGTLSRRVPTLVVLAVGQAAATAVVVACVLLSAPHAGSLAWLPESLLAGLAWALAMAAFYRALATGTMGVVAPVASCGMVVPVVVALVTGERPTLLQLVGVVAALAGVVGAAGPDLGGERAGARLPLLLALLAAAMFGLEITWLAQASQHSVLLSLLGMRAAALGAVLVALRVRPRPAQEGPLRLDARSLLTLSGLGLIDLAATATYAVAAGRGLVSLVAVLASLYPAVTVLLARQVHRERLSRPQSGGVLVVVVAAVCIALGGASA
ncbi:putative membrane protein [Motilibacter peucedani]|uniref:Putative membrane protein n=1 Tax=Motilibacter peucedani TaxID=598650 RepID=A0A420XMA5_9ACTN|nr:EamA family transporter [Motilibacter peucedani]RKS71380.1 putative membrane protein [Motilibacter peucedani]